MNIIIYLASAANGMISNQRNVPDWLSPEYGQGFMEMAQRTKAVIMGKTTYNILAPDYLPLKDEGSQVVLTHDKELSTAQPNVLFTGKDPHDIVKPGQIVKVKVLEVDLKRQRISLTMRFDEASGSRHASVAAHGSISRDRRDRRQPESQRAPEREPQTSGTMAMALALARAKLNK